MPLVELGRDEGTGGIIGIRENDSLWRKRNYSIIHPMTQLQHTTSKPYREYSHTETRELAKNCLEYCLWNKNKAVQLFADHFQHDRDFNRHSARYHINKAYDDRDMRRSFENLSSITMDVVARKIQQCDDNDDHQNLQSYLEHAQTIIKNVMGSGKAPVHNNFFHGGNTQPLTHTIAGLLDVESKLGLNAGNGGIVSQLLQSTGNEHLIGSATVIQATPETITDPLQPS